MREDGALPALGPPPEESQEGRGGRRALPLLRPGTDLLLVQTKIDLQIVAGYTLLYAVYGTQLKGDYCRLRELVPFSLVL